MKKLIGCTDFLDLLLEPDVMIYTVIKGYDLAIPLDKKALYEKFSSKVDEFQWACNTGGTIPDVPYAIIRRSTLDNRVVFLYMMGTLQECTSKGSFS